VAFVFHSYFIQSAGLTSVSERCRENQLVFHIEHPSRNSNLNIAVLKFNCFFFLTNVLFVDHRSAAAAVVTDDLLDEAAAASAAAEDDDVNTTIVPNQESPNRKTPDQQTQASETEEQSSESEDGKVKSSQGHAASSASSSPLFAVSTGASSAPLSVGRVWRRMLCLLGDPSTMSDEVCVCVCVYICVCVRVCVRVCVCVCACV
jgi:hypothetical protein